ncbi:MAG: hypothetical protein J0H54_08785 [Rhizobiales bacterium]|nr:hypothetical protein [Hyphomicrobiales bacterium]
MAKHSESTKTVVRDARSGRFIEVQGVGALKGNALPIKKGIDLTKPIASQTMKQPERKKK